MKGIVLRDYEVRRLASAGSVLIWRRVKSQPPEGVSDIRCSWFTPGQQGDAFFNDDSLVFGAYTLDGEWGCICPNGRTGETRFVKETWAPDMYDRRGGVVIYKCDGTHIVKWKPSTTMPSWASRFRVTVSVSCRQIQSVTEEEAVRSGSQDPVGHWKPVLQSRFTERDAFKQIMERVERGSWDRNEWYWCIEAKEVKI